MHLPLSNSNQRKKSCTLKIDVEIDAKLLPTKHQQTTKGSRGNNDSSLSNVITYSNCNGFPVAFSKYKEDKTHPFIFCIITGPKLYYIQQGLLMMKIITKKERDRERRK